MDNRFYVTILSCTNILYFCILTNEITQCTVLQNNFVLPHVCTGYGAKLL